MFKMATPQKFQFRMTKGWQNIWFRRTNEVHYIGGSDVLPAPLEQKCWKTWKAENIRKRPENG